MLPPPLRTPCSRGFGMADALNVKIAKAFLEVRGNGGSGGGGGRGLGRKTGEGPGIVGNRAF